MKKQQNNNLKTLKIWLIILAVLGFVNFQPDMIALIINDNRFSETVATIFLFLGANMRFAAFVLLIIYIVKKKKVKNNPQIVKTNFEETQNKAMDIINKDTQTKLNHPESFAKDNYFRNKESGKKFNSETANNNVKKAIKTNSVELSDYEKKKANIIKLCSILQNYLLQNDFKVLYTYEKNDNYYEHKLYMIKQACGFKFVLNTKNRGFESFGVQNREKEIGNDYCDNHSLSEFIGYMNLHLMISWFDEIGAVLYKIMKE